MKKTDIRELYGRVARVSFMSERGYSGKKTTFAKYLRVCCILMDRMKASTYQEDVFAYIDAIVRKYMEVDEATLPDVNEQPCVRLAQVIINYM